MKVYLAICREHFIRDIDITVHKTLEDAKKEAYEARGCRWDYVDIEEADLDSGMTYHVETVDLDEEDDE